MKKLFTLLMALTMVAVFATASFAVNKVQMTLTSPTIYKVGCEKIGSTTYSFDASSQIIAGDWWYMDLPQGITLCKNYNFVIAGIEDQANPNVHIRFSNANPYTTVGFNGGHISTSANSGDLGPLRAYGTTPSYIATGNMAFLVKGTNGSRRITIYALTPSATVGANQITVGTDSDMQVKLFDGRSFSKIDAIVADSTRILLDVDGDGTYGEQNYLGGSSALDEVIGGDATVTATTGIPYVENTLCSNNTTLAGEYVYTSYASRQDKFTFTGDSQIAHVAAANTIELKACKGLTTFDIEVVSSQAGTCSFSYDNVAVGMNGNYCDTNWPAMGQRFNIVANSGAFGDIEDKYWIDAEIVSPTSGVYFSGAPAITLIKANQDNCTVAGDAVTVLSGNPAPVFDPYEGSTKKTSADYPGSTCTVNAGKRINKLMQQTTSAFKVDGYNTIFVDFPAFVYGNTLVTVGNQVQVKLTMSKYPCGEIFTATRTIGTFVTSCTTASATTLLFPWLPGTGATGWWGGFVITNFGAAAGTATLTYRDSAGATATYTTAAIPANGQWANTGVTAADLTAGTGTYDGALNYSVSAVCSFAGRGFAFIGNGNEGTGYAVHP